MHKREVVSKLLYLNNRHLRMKGQRIFVLFFASWLRKLNIPADEKYDFYDITPYLPQLLVDAIEDLRTGTDEETVMLRNQYEKETDHSVPNLTELGESNGIERVLAVQGLGGILKAIVGELFIEHQMDAYANAQQHALQQRFDKFLRLVYRRGLFDVINACSISTMLGDFGATQLRSGSLAGRLMFTFARKIDKQREHSVSFVLKDGDPLGLSAGIQSVFTDFRTALDMIDEVINKWPSSSPEQKKVYRGNKKIGIG